MLLCLINCNVLFISNQFDTILVLLQFTVLNFVIIAFNICIILQACELRPTEIAHWQYLKRAQLTAGDEKGAQESDDIIDYLENYLENNQA